MKRNSPIPQAWGTAPIEFIDQDSPNENLDGEDLRNAVLKGSNLSGSSFRNADLSGATLYGCDLRNCDFTGAKLDRATLAFANVDGAVFNDCSMINTLLFGPEELFTVGEFNPSILKISGFVTDMTRESSNDVLNELRKSDDVEIFNQYIELALALFGADLTVPNTEPSTFGIALPYGHEDRYDIKTNKRNFQAKYVVYKPSFFNLSYWEVKETDLWPIGDSVPNLYGANLKNANLFGTALWGADLREANLQNANLYGAGEEGADLAGANLQGADLRNLSYGVNLEGADLRGANLENADLYEASLKGARLEGTNLQVYDFLQTVNLSGATYNATTALPDLDSYQERFREDLKKAYDSMIFVESDE